MLQLILGYPGTGKTHTVYEQLCEAARGGLQGIILLVPEQFSFESERALLRMLGPRLYNQIQVLSFTRMAEMVQRELGGFSGRRIDDPTRALLMSRTLEQCCDSLTLLRRSASDPSAVETVISMAGELAQCGISPAMLEQAADELADGPLRTKARELALIYAAYDALLTGVSAGTRYVDPKDSLSMLAERLPESVTGAGTLVFADGFKGFTVQELNVLRALMRKADKLTVTLCAESLDDAGGSGLFTTVADMARRLIDMARRDHVPVAVPVVLKHNHRAQNPELRHVGEGLFRPGYRAEGETGSGTVIVAACADKYEECDFVARSVRQYLRTEGGRCRDVAVVARSIDPYRGILDSAMERQGIAYLLDERSDVLTQPLTALIFAALDSANEGFRTDDMLCLLKTGLAGFSSDSAALIENYVLLWRVDGGKWRQPWTWNPMGLAVMMDEKAQKQLDHLNRLRRRLVKPLERLKSDLSAKCGGDTFSAAVYRYLESVRAPLLLRMRVSALDGAGEHALANRAAGLWDAVMRLLDRVAAVFGDDSIAPDRLTSMLRLAAQLTDIGEIPQSLDAVQIGAADHIRFSSPRLVYIIGANDGVFPRWPSGGGMLSDADRRELAQTGLPLYNDIEYESMEERLLAYLAAAAPSHRLIVSYSLKDSSGKALLPSTLVKSLERLFPDAGMVSVMDAADAESERDAFECAAAGWRDTTSEAAALRELFRTRPEYETRVRALERASARYPAAFEQDSAAKRLFGNNMSLSASRVETYYNCRFKYFCQYGMRAAPRRAAELNGLVYGTVIHWVMEHALPKYAESGYSGVTQSRARQDTLALIREYVDSHMGGLEDKPRRFEAQMNQLAHVAGMLVWRVTAELRQSRFEPVDYELPIGMETEDGSPQVPPVVLSLPDGANVRVIGKVDRVDIYEQDGIKYLRVVDYKSSGRPLLLSDVVEGLNVQMLIYLFTLWQNGGGRYGGVLPAGVLYLPAALPVVDAGRDDSPAEIAQLKKMRMTGLVLDDPEILRAMEQEAAGVFIPAKLTRDGTIDKSSCVASLEQMGQLKIKIEQLLSGMADTLRGGDIAAIPAEEACAYCDYYAVCGFEQGDPVRMIKKQNNSDVLLSLTQNE